MASMRQSLDRRTVERLAAMANAGLLSEEELVRFNRLLVVMQKNMGAFFGRECRVRFG
ncbi:MAG: hypothetical protein HQL82_01300 [Magnetococcales bacterium]|nr:hypothetical protein [Magnetococcales bacterium]